MRKRKEDYWTAFPISYAFCSAGCPWISPVPVTPPAKTVPVKRARSKQVIHPSKPLIALESTPSASSVAADRKYMSRKA